MIRKKNKTIFFDRSAYNLVKPINQIKITSNYLHKILKIMKKEGYVNKVISSDDIIKKIKLNFSRCWLWFYQFEIGFINLKYKI